MTESRPHSYLSENFELGKYQIKNLLGRGGMAEVYRATNPDLGQDVAIKVLNPQYLDSKEASERFRREAQASASLTHPNIVRVFDFSVQNHLHYMVMELLEGKTLSDLIEQFPEGMPFDLIKKYFEQLGAAVGYAHKQGVVHRDIKPSNVLLVNDRVVLTDFGLAKMVGQSKLTMSGMSSGTPAYMSPEQAAGEEITPATDVYSLGVVLYEMATGSVPFKGESFANILIKHLREAPPRPSEVSAHINPSLEPVILRALAKNPHHRYSTVEQMVKELTGSVEDISTETMTISTEIIQRAASQFPYNDDATRTFIEMPTPISGSMPGVPQVSPANDRMRYAFTALMLVMALAVAYFALVANNDDTNEASDSPTSEVVAPVGMVYVPAGELRMGTTNGASNEAPIHRVQLDQFFIDRTEVTNTDYLAFVEATGFEPQPIIWTRPDASVWEIEATDAYVIGDFDKRGAYDGVNVTVLNDATMHAELDADAETGLIVIEFNGTISPESGLEITGDIRIEHEVFTASANFQEGGVGDHVLMHGDSGQESSGLPRLIAPVATWGNARIYIDGELEYSDIGAHFMLVPGIRNDQLQILKADQTCCYDPINPSDGYIDDTLRQVDIFLFQGSATGGYSNPVPGAGPPERNVWLNIHFDTVDILQQPSSDIAKFDPSQANWPVSGVTWEAAQAYCEWSGKRLPTEAEWEYAARGQDGNLFPWGQNQSLNDRVPANTNGELPVDVGSYADGASPFGSLDMAGNVWEWVNDWYSDEYYSQSEVENPIGPSTGDLRVARGGGFFQRDPVGVTEFRTTMRLAMAPDTAMPDIGFRCANDFFTIEE